MQVQCYASGTKMLKEFEKEEFDILIMDIELPDDGTDNGMTISQRIKDRFPDTILIFVSGYNYYRELVNFEPFRFIPKPIDEDRLKIGRAHV